MKRIENLKKRWRRYTTRGTDNLAHQSRMVRIVFLNNFSIIAATAAIIFATLNYVTSNETLAFIEASFGLGLLVNIALLHKYRRYTFSANFTLVLVFLLGATLVFTGGIEGTGIYWLFIIPIISFFLTGRVSGLVWSSALFVFGLSLLILQDASVLSIPYEFIEMRQFIATVFIMTIILYSYEHASSQNRKLIHQRTNDLVKSYHRTKKEAEAKEETQEKLERVLREAEKRNEHLERTKLAITNLLEDLQEEKDKIQELSLKDETVLRSVGEGLIATNQDGEIIRLSDSIIDMVNKDAGQLVGSHITEAYEVYNFEGDKIEKEKRVEYLALNTGKTEKQRYQIRRNDGSSFFALVTAAPYRIHGKLSGAVVTVRDVTTETEIDKAKSEFVSLASHQLRTPLTAINWYIEMMQDVDESEIPQQMHDYLNEIEAASNRMVDLVNALLNVSRIDLGTFMIEPKLTDIHHSIKTTIKELKEPINDKNISVKLQFDKRIKELNVDPKLVYVVFQNLISNAVKYSDMNGNVWIRTKKTDDVVRIEVEDEGYGIPKSQQDKVFSKLFRADNVVRKDTDGTGLGLYITKAIIKESGGSIGFESEEGAGTKFTIELPLEGMKQRAGSKMLSTVR